MIKNKKTYCFILLLFTLLFIQSVYAAPFPQPSGYVNDFAGLLSPQEKTTLESELREMERNTTVEVVVVTVTSLEGMSKEEYALSIAEQWGVGKKGTDNGLVILVAKEEREYRFEVGKGLEGVLNDAKVGRIGRDIIVPAFRRGEYGKGLLNAVQETRGIVEEDPAVVAKYAPDPLAPYVGMIGFGYALFFILLGVITINNRKKWLVRLGGNGVAIASALFIGTTVIFIAIVFSIMFWVFIAQLSFARRMGGGGITGRGFGHRRFGGGGLGGGSIGGFGGFGGGGFSGGGAGGKW